MILFSGEEEFDVSPQLVRRPNRQQERTPSECSSPLLHSDSLGASPLHSNVDHERSGSSRRGSRGGGSSGRGEFDFFSPRYRIRLNTSLI